jgi:type II secretory pathway component PulC
MMRRNRTRARFVWLLGAAFIALVLVIYAEISILLTNDGLESDDAAPRNLSAPISSPPLFAMPDRASLAVILERPVFSETRRPSEDPAGAQATATDFTLAGVVISASERSVLVKPGNGGMIQRLKEGDDIGGWILEEIAFDRIKIRRGAVEAEMLIDYAAPAPLIPRTETRKQKSAANPAAQRPAKQLPTQLGDAKVEPEEDTQY